MPISKQTKKTNGVIYTPHLLAEYVAKKTLWYFLEVNNFPQNIPFDYSNLRVLDPACGKGELLKAFWLAFSIRSLDSMSGLDPYEVLCGIDIDKNAVTYTRHQIKMLSNENKSKKPSNVIVGNTLLLSTDYYPSKNLSSIKGRFNAPKGFDILIANPPWGADISSFKLKLNTSLYSLLKGQFDTSDLFFELALRLTKPNGLVAFIIPDSLFAVERKKLRNLIATKTQMLYLARLGEGFFPDVFRGCAVIIVRNALPTTNNKVECLRLDPNTRRAILNNQVSFADTEKKLSTHIPQSRFINNPGNLFDIDTKSNEAQLIKRIISSGGQIRDCLDSFRGVELSKRGSITYCNNCLKWSPTPTKLVKICAKCKNPIDLDRALTVRIISNTPLEGYSHIIVGESITRYKVQNHLFIDLSKDGINYKLKASFPREKIVVRKTGVGITAAIDYSGALTNQVVYSFIQKGDSPISHSLEVYIAILNSRMMYYYIIKRYGETEWRSHPYLTLEHVRDLPIPKDIQLKLESFPKSEKLLRELHNTLIIEKELSKHLDIQLERLVAHLFDLKISDYRTIYKTLSSIEKLRPVRTLLSISPDDIFE